MNWRSLFDNPRNLRLGAVALAVGLLALLTLSVTLRLTGGGPPPDAARPGPTVSATPTSDLVPPSPETTDVAVPDVDYGDPAPVVAEAVQAFLDHDVAKFAAVASPDVAEEVAAAPAPRTGQKITGDIAVMEPGPTEQTLRVPTTDGTLELVMIVVQESGVGHWLVSDIKYVQ